MDGDVDDGQTPVLPRVVMVVDERFFPRAAVVPAGGGWNANTELAHPGGTAQGWLTAEEHEGGEQKGGAQGSVVCCRHSASKWPADPRTAVPLRENAAALPCGGATNSGFRKGGRGHVGERDGAASCGGTPSSSNVEGMDMSTSASNGLRSGRGRCSNGRVTLPCRGVGRSAATAAAGLTYRQLFEWWCWRAAVVLLLSPTAASRNDGPTERVADSNTDGEDERDEEEEADDDEA